SATCSMSGSFHAWSSIVTRWSTRPGPSRLIRGAPRRCGARTPVPTSLWWAVLWMWGLARVVEECDAAVHAAGDFSFDPRRAEEMRRTSASATELVVGGAVERGLDP